MKGNADTESIDIDQEVETGNIIGAGVMRALEEGKEVEVQKCDTADIAVEVWIEDIGQGGTMEILEAITNEIDYLEEVAHLRYAVEKKECRGGGVNSLHCLYIGGLLEWRCVYKSIPMAALAFEVHTIYEGMNDIKSFRIFHSTSDGYE